MRVGVRVVVGAKATLVGEITAVAVAVAAGLGDSVREDAAVGMGLGASVGGSPVGVDGLVGRAVGVETSTLCWVFGGVGVAFLAPLAPKSRPQMEIGGTETTIKITTTRMAKEMRERDCARGLFLSGGRLCELMA